MAQPVAVGEGKEHVETPVNGGVCRGLAEGDVVGAMERAKGFEPKHPKPPTPDGIGVTAHK